MAIEQHALLCEIRQRYKRGETAWHLNDIALLLSLLDSDSQAADKSAHELAVEWSQSTSDDGISVDDINRLAQLIDKRVAAMRDKCVEKVKEMRGNWHDQYVAADSSTREALVRKEMLFAQCCAARDIIKELESLTFMQERPTA